MGLRIPDHYMRSNQLVQETHATSTTSTIDKEKPPRTSRQIQPVDSVVRSMGGGYWTYV